jgi:hypothetical protein
MAWSCKVNGAQNTVYEIRVAGHLGRHHARQFEGMEITWDVRGETVIVGPVADQAALHGLLSRIRDLAVPLLSIRRLSQGDTPADDACVEDQGGHDD